MNEMGYFENSYKNSELKNKSWEIKILHYIPFTGKKFYTPVSLPNPGFIKIHSS